MSALHAAEMVELATKLWGEPTSTSRTEARFGTHGSKHIDLTKAVYFDHEAGPPGGGYRDLYKLVHGEFPENGNGKASNKFNIIAKYDYCDKDAKLIFQVVRVSPKSFRQRQPNGKGGWAWNTAGVTKVLYRLPELLAEPNTSNVYVVEGEKDVDELRQHLLTATCNPGGAECSGGSKWLPTMSDSLRGRDVVILPDNDEAGEKHATNIANSLKGKAKSIRIVRLPNLPDKGDVSDWFAAGGTVEELERLASEAPEYKAEPEAADPTNFPLLTIADLEAMPDPVWLVDDLLVANSLCVLYGPWGSFKSFIALHLALCIATGMAFFGRAVVQSNVVYIAGEGAGGIKKRVAAWKKHYGIKDIPGFRVIPVAVNLLDRTEAERLIKTVQDALKAGGFNPKLAIVDTLHRSMPGGDENAAKEMGIVIANGAHIQCKLGCTLMPVHHSGKDFERGMRGSTGLPGACDTILRATREATSSRSLLLVEKQKDGEDGQELNLIAVVTDLPPAENGKPRSSLVLVADSEPQAKQNSPFPERRQGEAVPGRVDRRQG